MHKTTAVYCVIFFWWDTKPLLSGIFSVVGIVLAMLFQNSLSLSYLTDKAGLADVLAVFVR